jgi:hypothetical protein
LKPRVAGGAHIEEASAFGLSCYPQQAFGLNNDKLAFVGLEDWRTTERMQTAAKWCTNGIDWDNIQLVAVVLRPPLLEQLSI